MKQQIICPECKDKNRKMFKTDTPYHGEYVKFISGHALRDFVCDHCATEIEAGTECCAFSIWADHGRHPYYPWEHEFIEFIDEESLKVANEVNDVMAKLDNKKEYTDG
jgi:hypothetical protein